GVSRTGSQPTGNTTVQYRINTSSGYSPAGGTSAINVDYTFSSGTLVFSPTDIQKEINLTIIDDIIDEFDETVVLEIYNISTTGSPVTFEPGKTQIEITITDNDDAPTVFFVSPTSQFTETTNDASALIELSAPSAKEVVVSYQIVTTLPNNAEGGGVDYSTSSTGQLVFPPSSVANPDTLRRLNMNLVADDPIPPPLPPEGDEIIEIELTTAINGIIDVSQLRHELTIKDYTEFEFQGAAGVGKELDNIIWIRADQQNVTNNGDRIQVLGNSSPHNFTISQSDNNRRARLFTTSKLINGWNTLEFDGDDYYTLANYGLINSASFYDRKDFFLVIKPNNITPPERQVIYKQGGGSRGFAIYLEPAAGGQYTLYFHGWNNPSSDPGAPWGATGSGTASTTHARFEGLLPGSEYVVSCHYNANESVATDKLRIFVNGTKGIPTNTSSVGRIFAHTGAVSLGGLDGSALYHDNTSSAQPYHGIIAEFLGYSDAPMTESRRLILTNYFSGKYDIPLTEDQVFDITSGSTTFKRNIAGIGYENANDQHGDARGPSILRVSSSFANSDGDDFILWGHNDIALDVAYPYSNSSLPAPVVERSGRVWQFFKQGVVDEIDLRINISSLENANLASTSNMVLLRHNNVDPQDFSGATVFPATDEPDPGVTMEFSNVSISDGDYIAIASISSALPLPIELLSFDAKLKGTYVDLNWSTATELNNDYFVVERAGEDLIWEPILEKSGAGNSNSLISYSDKDRNPLKGISYYRLKQVDFDGGFSYSDPVSVFNNQIEDREEVFMYPNPSAMGSVFLRLPSITR
ncbi:MAG: Calx-beta domain-containing protein, partial [Cryomorphaceae bacterium]